MNPLYTALIYVVWFLSTYFVVLILLVLTTHRQLFEGRTLRKDARLPLVSILVPAFNEEKKIGETIASLKQVTYPNVEFIILNDGSRDRTSDVVRENILGDSTFRFIDNPKNKGKAACLNQGIAQAKGELIACMDADSSIEPGIIQKVLPYFDDRETGAVTVSVRVKNPKGLLQKIIDIEYLLGLSLFLKLFSKLDSIFVTPGPFSMYRASVLSEIGGFDITNIVEDHEIAYRIHKAGHKIRNCLEAHVHTILPETFRGLYVQRRRWYSGAVRTLIQHKDVCFKGKYGYFGVFAPLNQVLIFLGIILFGFTLYLSAGHLVDNILYLRYADLDLFNRLAEFDIDLLALGKSLFFGLTSFAGTILMMILGLRATRGMFAGRKAGIVAYPFIFILYQIFWIGAYAAVIRGAKVKWR